MTPKEKNDILMKELLEIKDDNAPLILFNRYKRKSEIDDVIEFLCNTLLDFIQRSAYRYTDEFFKSSKDISFFLQITDHISINANSYLIYYKAIAAYFRGEYPKTLALLKNCIPKIVDESNEKEPFDDVALTVYFIAPFKNAFPGFWEALEKMLAVLPIAPELIRLCRTVSAVYASSDTEEIQKCLDTAFSEIPGSIIIRELMAENYYNRQMWGNAVALFEQIESPFTMFKDDALFMGAWCYGKIGETQHEIEAYQQCVEIFKEHPFALNNLGYAYYRAKYYNKALEVFQQCIDLKIDLKYAANNYVRTLLASKQIEQAKTFVKNPPVAINKTLLKKVLSSDDSIQSTDDSQPLTKENADYTDDNTIGKQKVKTQIKSQQFTSERLLEEELLHRMESGVEIFGRHLKIYRRKGVYGRQYILANGKRIDLLAEDNAGNLYIIELKKDDGYDDAYTQTAGYLSWFEENWHEKHANIYGIICLNNPSAELLSKVHADKRIQVFEYQISYTER